MSAAEAALPRRAFALRGGITLQALEGPAAPAAGGAQGRVSHKPRVLLLHGFPEGAFVWAPLMHQLAPYAQLLAPWLRGYAPSSAPAEVSAYRARVLVDDLVQLIEQWGAPLDLLVAHDWGGALAWNLAAAHPRLMRRLLIINAPHPAALLRELRHNPAQRQASAYMAELVRPDIAARLARDRWAPLLAFFGTAGWLDEAARERYRAQWGSGLEGALNIYRASPLRPDEAGGVPGLAGLELPRQLTDVPVPTTVLWGERDHALLPALADGLERWVPALRLVRLPEASHWVVHEEPARVAAEIRRALEA